MNKKIIILGVGGNCIDILDTVISINEKEDREVYSCMGFLDDDKETWEKLYKGYANFYKVEMNDKILQAVWNWLHDKSHEVNGLVYEVDGNIVGLAHYRRMPRPLRGQDIGFLDDLFVDPDHRGQRIGEKVLNELKKISKSKGWNLVRWITHNDNIRAKSLYDRVSEKTTWDVYELKLKNN